MKLTNCFLRWDHEELKLLLCTLKDSKSGIIGYINTTLECNHRSRSLNAKQPQQPHPGKSLGGTSSSIVSSSTKVDASSSRKEADQAGAFHKESIKVSVEQSKDITWDI